MTKRNRLEGTCHEQLRGSGYIDNACFNPHSPSCHDAFQEANQALNTSRTAMLRSLLIDDTIGLY